MVLCAAFGMFGQPSCARHRAIAARFAAGGSGVSFLNGGRRVGCPIYTRPISGQNRQYLQDSAGNFWVSRWFGTTSS